MRLLLDTHTFLWAASNPAALIKDASDKIRAPNNEVWLSLASAWELSIKSSTGKLQLSKPIELFVAEMSGAATLGFYRFLWNTSQSSKICRSITATRLIVCSLPKV